MGAGVKTIQRIMEMTEENRLLYGAEICDIGTTQIFGSGGKEAARSMLNYYSRQASPDAQKSDVSDDRLSIIADGGFFGELLKMAGFQYTALDIFNAPDTILFDLNRHAPGPKLKERFDLVMNFGTTEHVFNQFNAFRTIHQLTKVNGLMYHDLPMAGYFNHAFFRYDPLFFNMLSAENGYEVISLRFSVGESKPISVDLRSSGLSIDSIVDVGIEAILRKTRDAVFRVPLEQSTSIALEPMREDVADNINVIDIDQDTRLIQYSLGPGIQNRIRLVTSDFFQSISNRLSGKK